MYDRTGNYLIVAILIGMILGVVTVALFGEAMLPVKFLGDIFLNALKMVVIPLLFCSMIVGITNLGDVRKLGRTGLKTLLYFIATSSIAVIIGLVLVNIFQPGAGFGTLGASLPEAIQNRESYSFFSWLSDQIPSNLIGAAAETRVLPIIVFALFFGGVLTTIGAKGKPVITFFEGLNEAIMKIVHIIMWFAPIGIFGLVAGQLAMQGGMSGFTSVLSALGKYSLVVILGLLLHGVIVLPLILKFVGGKNPIEYLVGMSQALMTAFATASSSATLPVTMDCVEEKNDIDKRASSFVLPLGATINMDGTALYEAVAAMFIAQAYGIDLSILSQVTIFATAVLASVGAAGIPQAGLVTMVLVLQAVGLPLEGIGLILAIDWFLDRCRTTINVWGDSIGAAVIATSAEIGLVDRSKAKTPKKERYSRVRGFTRRQESRGKRKPQDQTGAPGRERIQDSRREGNGAQKDASHRRTRGSRKSDRYGTPRKFRMDDQGPSKSNSGLREEYKPQSEAPKDSAKVKPEKIDNRVTANEPKPAPGPSENKKQTYGRRQSHPPHGRRKSQDFDTRKEVPETTTSEKVVDQQSDDKPKSTFEIPKFPATILDDLGATEKDLDTSKADSRADQDQGDRDDRMEKHAFRSKAGSHNDRMNERASNRDSTLTAEKDDAGNGDSGEKTPADDFSRLDQAVLGNLTASDNNNTESSVFAEKDDSMISPDAEKTDSGSEPDIDSKPDAKFDYRRPRRKKPDEAKIRAVSENRMEKSSDSIEPHEETVSEKAVENSPAGDGDNHFRPEDSEERKFSSSEQTDKPEVEPAADEDYFAVEETSGTENGSEMEASNDDDSKDESMRWGRPKRKKMSR